MQPKFTSYALLGSGRVARHFQFYLTSLGLPFTTWSRSAVHADLGEALSKASHVLLAVSDRAIGELAARATVEGAGRTLVHFSGTARVEGAVAAHPLMTFTPVLESKAWYRTIPFVIDEGAEFSAVLPGLPNPHFALKAELRPLYHALVSLAGNSSFLLWRSAGDEFERKLGLPRRLLAPFLHQVVETATRAEAGGFTGPVARGDWQTVASHLAALRSGPLADHYHEFLNSASRAGYSVPKEML